MRALLDINVLIALFDSAHTQHRSAHAWLHENIESGWASCPITQNGVIRIMSQPGYPRPISVTSAAELLRGATSTAHHVFWPDDVSILEAARIDTTRIHGPRQLTDTYLLALAATHGGRFVTFDTAVPSSAVRGLDKAHLLVL